MEGNGALMEPHSMYLDLLIGESGEHPSHIQQKELSPREAAKAMREVVNEVMDMKPTSSRSLMGRLAEPAGVGSLASALAVYVPDMGPADVSNVVWGLGTIVKRQNSAASSSLSSSGGFLLPENYRREGQLLRGRGLAQKRALNAPVAELARAAIASFSENADTLSVNSTRVSVSKLVLGLGRLAQSSGLSWDDFGDDGDKKEGEGGDKGDITRNQLLKVLRLATKGDALVGSNGQPLSNVLWGLSQLQTDFWRDLTPDLRSSLMAVVYKESRDDTDFTDQALSTVLLSLAKIGVTWDKLPLAVRSALSTSLCRVSLRVGEKEMSSQAVGNVLYALGSMGATGSEMTDRVALALEISIRRTARQNRLREDDAVQVMQGLALMRYRWRGGSLDAAGTGKKRELPQDELRLGPQACAHLANALYVTQVSISANAGLVGLLRLGTILQALVTMQAHWLQLDPPLKAAVLLGLAAARTLPSTAGESGGSAKESARPRTLFAPDRQEDPSQALLGLRALGYSPSEVSRGLAATLYYLRKLGLGSITALPQSSLDGLWDAIGMLADTTTPTTYADSSASGGNGGNGGNGQHMSRALAGTDLAQTVLSLAHLGAGWGNVPVPTRTSLLAASQAELVQVTRSVNFVAVSDGTNKIATTGQDQEERSSSSPRSLANLVYGLGILARAAPENIAILRSLRESAASAVAAVLSTRMKHAAADCDAAPGVLVDVVPLLHAAATLRIPATLLERQSSARYKNGGGLAQSLWSLLGSAAAQSLEMNADSDLSTHVAKAARALAALGLVPAVSASDNDTLIDDVLPVVTLVCTYGSARDLAGLSWALGKAAFRWNRSDDSSPSQQRILSKSASESLSTAFRRAFSDPGAGAQTHCTLIFAFGHLLKAPMHALHTPKKLDAFLCALAATARSPAFRHAEIGSLVLGLSSAGFSVVVDSSSPNGAVEAETESLVRVLVDAVADCAAAQQASSRATVVLVSALASLDGMYAGVVHAHPRVRTAIGSAVASLLRGSSNQMPTPEEAATLLRLLRRLGWLTGAGMTSADVKVLRERASRAAAVFATANERKERGDYAPADGGEELMLLLSTFADEEIMMSSTPQSAGTSITMPSPLQDGSSGSGNEGESEDLEALLLQMETAVIDAERAAAVHNSAPMEEEEEDNEKDGGVTRRSVQFDYRTLTAEGGDNSAEDILQYWSSGGLRWSSLDKDARRALVLTCTLAAEESAGGGNTSTVGSKSKPLTGAVRALTMLVGTGVKWGDLPTRPRNKLALAVAVQARAVTGKLSRLVSSARDSSKTTTDHDDKEELVVEYLSLLFSLCRLQCRLHIVPKQIRNALGEGYWCLQKLCEGQGQNLEQRQQQWQQWRRAAREMLFELRGQEERTDK
jgi:hypothetical protein